MHCKASNYLLTNINIIWIEIQSNYFYKILHLNRYNNKMQITLKYQYNATVKEIRYK